MRINYEILDVPPRSRWDAKVASYATVGFNVVGKELQLGGAMKSDTKKQLVEVIKEGKISDLEKKVFEFFGSIDNLIEFDETWPRHEGLTSRYCLEEFLKSRNLELSIFSYVEEGYLRPSRFSDVEYAPGKYRSCLERGSFFVWSKDKKIKLLVQADESRYEDRFIFSVICAQSDTEYATTFVREFRQYCVDHNIFKKQKLRADLAFIKQEKSYSWDDLVLDKDTSNAIKTNLLTILNKNVLYSKFGVSHKRGIIFSGEPGTGKTLVGKILCSTLTDWSFIWVSPGDLGRVEKLKAYVGLAKAIAPTILFLEDLDMHFQNREVNGYNSMLGELMNQLDGIEDVNNVIVVGTTNRPGELEKALAKRPGRFDKVIEFKKPEGQLQRKMFEVFGKDRLSDDIDWVKILSHTKNFTGAQIKEALNMAVLTALEKASDSIQDIKLSTDQLLDGVKSAAGKDFSVPSQVGFTSSASPAYDD